VASQTFTIIVKVEELKSFLIPGLHDQANIKQSSSKCQANVEQTSSKRQAIRAHVEHVYFEYICLMVA